MSHRLRQLYAGLFLISASTLLLELALTRIFDVILYNNLAYLVVSSAMFGFGLGGVGAMLWPMTGVATDRLLAVFAGVFSLLVLLLIVSLKTSPADFNELSTHPIRQSIAFAGLYLFVLAPFLAAGFVVALAVMRRAEQIHQLYFWDLAGAGVGCLAIFVLPELIGGEETLLVVAAGGAFAAALFAGGRGLMGKLSIAGAIAGIVLTVLLSNRIEFESLITKRNIRLGESHQASEFSRWDPVSKIDVLPQDVPWRKRIAYDGGAQSSAFYQFDGDFVRTRDHYFEVVDGQSRYNSGKYVALAHWLKREKSPRTLVIGSAGGQETLAALTWGASHVDAVEMVCAVIAAGKGKYHDFIGGIFDNARVTTHCDEGRNFLAHSNSRYDVIQIHSNHTTSSIANGSGGAMPVYLQTVDAYRDYLSHLSADGLLQINYFVYPRMITTAAEAWSQIFPGDDFADHLVITSGFGIMPTFLVKRSPWSAAEIAEVRHFMGSEFPDVFKDNRIIYAPGQAEAASVPPELFKVPLSEAVADTVPYQISPPTDNRPFFRNLRKEVKPLEVDGRGYVTPDTVVFLNSSLRGSIPMESVHLYLLGGASVVVAAAMLLLPLVLLRRRGLGHANAAPTLVYFACLGAGFVMIELALMSKFVLIVGYPIYAMATVLLTLLIAAACGSYLAERISDRWGTRAIAAIPIFGLVMLAIILGHSGVRDVTLGLSQSTRIILVALLLVPIGIPLGMPFPLAIAALRKRSPDLILWAWGINGFMSVVGSLLAVIFELKYGFNATLLIAVAIYLLAVPCFIKITRDSEKVFDSADLQRLEASVQRAE
jgi:spermidine synthase/MFS family permease